MRQIADLETLVVCRDQVHELILWMRSYLAALLLRSGMSTTCYV